MTDYIPGDLMRRHDELAEMEKQHRDRKPDMPQQIGIELETTIETTYGHLSRGDSKRYAALSV